jgi:hypothetical protein
VLQGGSRPALEARALIPILDCPIVASLKIIHPNRLSRVWTKLTKEELAFRSELSRYYSSLLELNQGSTTFDMLMSVTYLLRHAELPPLNYQFNWQPFKEIGWRVFDDPTCFGRGDGL